MTRLNTHLLYDVYNHLSRTLIAMLLRNVTFWSITNTKQIFSWIVDTGDLYEQQNHYRA